MKSHPIASIAKALLVPTLALALAACQVEEDDERELPEVEREEEGRSYELEVPEVEIEEGKDTLLIPIPDVDVKRPRDRGGR